MTDRFVVRPKGAEKMRQPLVFAVSAHIAIYIINGR